MTSVTTAPEPATMKTPRPATTSSAIYTGTIRHRRYAVRQREFTYKLGLLYLDLDELPKLLHGRFMRPGPGTARFRRQDFHRPGDGDLKAAVRDSVKQLSGIDTNGPVRLLAQLRTFGAAFNPVSFYYCFDESGTAIEAVLAEVTNTPWRERHAYVITPGENGRVLRSEFDKKLHVSPFMPMNHRYSASLTNPAQTLSVHIENWDGEQLQFDATLRLRRQALTAGNLRRLNLSRPLGATSVLRQIYTQGVKIRLAGIRVHPHPVRDTK